MWTEIARTQYDGHGRRYSSDAVDAEWSHINLLLPPAKSAGRPHKTVLRKLFDAIL